MEGCFCLFVQSLILVPQIFVFFLWRSMAYWYTHSASVPKGLGSNPAQDLVIQWKYLKYSIDAELYKCWFFWVAFVGFWVHRVSRGWVLCVLLRHFVPPFKKKNSTKLILMALKDDWYILTPKMTLFIFYEILILKRFCKRIL